MPKVAFFTVVYPGIESYFVDFSTSIVQQTNREFDLIIFNESNTVIDFETLLNGINYKVIATDPATPIKIRERGLSYLRHNSYDYVVFGDADDWFAPNRVAKSMELLEHFDLVVNDVDIVTDTETLIASYFSHRVKNRSALTLEMSLHGNCMGLSAAAIKLTSLPEFITPLGVVALDWYMFTRMLLEGSKAVFTNETTTYYRQYDSNLVGMKMMTMESLKREVSIKLGHYRALQKENDRYDVLATNFGKLDKTLSHKVELQSLYSKIRDNKIDFPFWWENTKDGQLCN